MVGAVSFYRVANFLYRKKIPFLPKVITYCNRLLFACWLSYGANAVVIDSVPPNCVIAGVPAKTIWEGINSLEYLYHLKK